MPKTTGTNVRYMRAVRSRFVFGGVDFEFTLLLNLIVLSHLTAVRTDAVCGRLGLIFVGITRKDQNRLGAS